VVVSKTKLNKTTQTFVGGHSFLFVLNVSWCKTFVRADLLRDVGKQSAGYGNITHRPMRRRRQASQ